MIRFCTVVAFLLFSLPVFGDVIIDFATGTGGVGGVFTFDGINATGSLIPIGTMTVAGVAGHDGVYITSGSCSTFACLNFDTGKQTNYIEIVGGIPDLDILALVDQIGTVLLHGSFNSFLASDTVGLYNAEGRDTKNPLLLDKLGLSTDLDFGYFGSSYTANRIPDSRSYTIISTDIRNTAQVPETINILQLGLMALGCAVFMWRRGVA